MALDSSNTIIRKVVKELAINKSEAQIRKTLDYLTRIRDSPTLYADDRGATEDILKSMDIFLWILGETDDDGMPSQFDKFLDALSFEHEVRQ